MRVRQRTSFYDLVERSAARLRTPRLEFWQSVARALLNKQLPALNVLELINPKIYPAMTYADWLIGFRASADRHNDPAICRDILNQIIVRPSDFEKWLRNGKKRSQRGPERGTTGFRTLDRKLFSKISKLLKTGKARSAYGAALLLHEEIAGRASPENKARRVSARYRKERAADR
jgi:hypothetical protein